METHVCWEMFICKESTMVAVLTGWLMSCKLRVLCSRWMGLWLCKMNLKGWMEQMLFQVALSTAWSIGIRMWYGCDKNCTKITNSHISHYLATLCQLTMSLSVVKYEVELNENLVHFIPFLPGSIKNTINLTLVIPVCIWTNKCESNSV
jgi:hypothetical protein